MDRQLSLLERQHLTTPGASDVDRVRAVAAGVIAELGLEPPIDPGIVASYLGVTDVQAVELDVAGCLHCERDNVVIKVRGSDPNSRKRFTVCHECSHIFFPGFARRTQYRCQPGLAEVRDPDLEALCDIGASELLLPRRYFEEDIATREFGLQAVEELSGIYEASLEATAHRVVTLSRTPLALLILEVMNKPAETGRPDAEPKLRIRAARTNGDWPFFPHYKSVPSDSPFHLALEGDLVLKRTQLSGVCRESVCEVEVSAGYYPYRDRQRVLALLRPALRRTAASRP